MQRGANLTIVGTMLTKTSQSIMYVAAPLSYPTNFFITKSCLSLRPCLHGVGGPGLVG